MRQIQVKYESECKKCGAVLGVGTPAMYEKSMGCFCLGCEPKEVEDIRAFRLEKAKRKAERYEGWAAKRKEKAHRDLNSFPIIRWVFIPQPEGEIMEKILMYCYSGETWDSTPIKDKAICDIGRMTHRMVAKIADIQQELLGRKVYIKRVTESE